jgi:hypothetical protein
MATEYRFGRPSLEEWHGLWKAQPHDPDATGAEFHVAFDSLVKWLTGYGKNGIKADDDFFLTGEFQGDRTQVVELVNPNALTLRFILYLQRWITEYYPSWRIVIPTYLGPHNVILIFEDRIRANKEYDDNLERSLEEIIKRMLLLDTYKHLRKRS